MIKKYWFAFFSGVIGIGCCVSPIFLVILGLTSASAAVDLAYDLYADFRWHFRVLGLILLSFSLYYYLRKRNQCSIHGAYKNRSFILGSSAIFLVTYLIFYFLTTLLGRLAKSG